MPRTDLTMVAPYPRHSREGALASGVAAYTERLCGALARNGLSVRVLAPRVDDEPEQVSHGGVTVQRVYRRGPGALLAATRTADREGSPVVHVQHEMFLYGGASSIPGVAPALLHLRRQRRGPVVTLHQVVDPVLVDREFTRTHRVRVPHYIARAALSAVQRTVASASATTVVHEKAFADIVPEASVVPMGIDPHNPTPPDARLKLELGLRPDRLTALCFGFLSPYKGLETALDADSYAGDEVDLVIAGGSHPRLAGRDPYAEDLERRYGASARFVGYVPEDDVARWFAAADVLLLPYPKPFASSGPFAQALGFGTPVLCSPALARCVGAPDVLVAPAEAPALGARLRELARDRERLGSMRAATRALAMGRTWDDVAHRHIALYEEVMDAQGTARRRFRTGESR